MSNKSLEKIAKSALFVIVGLFISKLLGYTYKIIIARIGTEQYGLFSTGLAIIGIFTTLSFLGLHEGIIRYTAYYREKKELNKMQGAFISIFSITSILSIISACLLFIFANKISFMFFKNDSLSLILKILALAIPFDVIKNIFLNTIKSFEIIKYEIYIKQILENTLKVIITAFLIYLGLGILGATIAYVIALVIGLIASAYFLQKKVYPYFNNKIKPFFETKELFYYSLPLLFSGFLLMIFTWTDTLMLGKLMQASDVGIYNAAMTTAKLLFTAPFAFSIIFLPIATALYAKAKHKEIKEIYQSTTKWMFIINIFLFGILAIFSRPILNILFGQDYIKGWSSLILLSSGFFFLYCFNNATYMLRVMKKTKLEFRNLLISGIINIILNYLFIPKWGILGAAIATAISSIILGILEGGAVYILGKILPFNFKFLNILFSAILVLIPLYFISSKSNITFNLLNLILIGGGSLILYILLLILTKTFDKNDKEIIRLFVNKIK